MSGAGDCIGFLALCTLPSSAAARKALEKLSRCGSTSFKNTTHKPGSEGGKQARSWVQPKHSARGSKDSGFLRSGSWGALKGFAAGSSARSVALTVIKPSQRGLRDLPAVAGTLQVVGVLLLGLMAVQCYYWSCMKKTAWLG